MSVIQLNLGLSRLRDNRLDGYTQDKVEKIAAVPEFAPAITQFDLVVAKLDEYRMSLASAVDGSKSDTAYKNLVRKELQDAVTRLAFKIREIADGNVVLFLKSGFAIKSNSEPIGLLDRPTGLEASEGPFSASVALSWDPEPNADSFLVEMTTTVEDEAAWKPVATPTRSETLVTRLVSGTKYWFRVAAVNTAGRTEYSDPAFKYAP